MQQILQFNRIIFGGIKLLNWRSTS